jgi:diguanylate cyclase (GGDEF)-like protein
MKTYFPYQSVAVLLIDDDTKELRIKISRQISYTFVKKFRKEGPSPTAERVVLEQSPMLIAAADPASEVYGELKLEHDFSSAVLAPVIRNQRGVGYVFCDRAADDPAFTESDQLHLQVVGYLIGSMMEKFDLVQESKRLSQVDDATGVLQYKAFVPALGTEFERAKKHGYDVVLSLLAVEAFRKYVETYGIDQAHALLEEVAGVIKECITDMDVLARFGADQFVLCLSGLTRDEATERLARIRNTIQERVVGQGDFAIDAAVGALVLQGEADMRRSLQDILSALGKSLVKAKSQKGSTVSIETMPAPA